MMPFDIAGTLIVTACAVVTTCACGMVVVGVPPLVRARRWAETAFLLLFCGGTSALSVWMLRALLVDVQ